MEWLETEWMSFVQAVFSGMFVYWVYFCIRKLRRIVPHNLAAISIEDGVFWLATSIYLFVQIYHTNNGNIRLYYVLGLVLGAVLSWKILRLFEKVWKKFVHFKKEKTRISIR